MEKNESADNLGSAKAVEASEAKYKALFEGISDAVFVHRLKTEGFNNFVEVNEVSCQRLGYSREELLNLSPKDISAPEDVESKGASESRAKLLREKWALFEAVHIAKDHVIGPRYH